MARDLGGFKRYHRIVPSAIFRYATFNNGALCSLATHAVTGYIVPATQANIQ